MIEFSQQSSESSETKRLDIVVNFGQRDLIISCKSLTDNGGQSSINQSDKTGQISSSSVEKVLGKKINIGIKSLIDGRIPFSSEKLKIWMRLYIITESRDSHCSVFD